MMHACSLQRACFKQWTSGRARALSTLDLGLALAPYTLTHTRPSLPLPPLFPPSSPSLSSMALLLLLPSRLAAAMGVTMTGVKYSAQLTSWCAGGAKGRWCSSSPLQQVTHTHIHTPRSGSLCDIIEYK
jgi:hypothetical protein